MTENPRFPSRRRIRDAKVRGVGAVATMRGGDAYPAKKYSILEIEYNEDTTDYVPGKAKLYIAIQNKETGEWEHIKDNGLSRARILPPNKITPTVDVGDTISFTSQSRDPHIFSITENQEFVNEKVVRVPEDPQCPGFTFDCKSAGGKEVVAYLANRFGIRYTTLFLKSSSGSYYFKMDGVPTKVGIREGLEREIYKYLFTEDELKKYFDSPSGEQEARELIGWSHLSGNSPASRTKSVVVDYWKDLCKRVQHKDGVVKETEVDVVTMVTLLGQYFGFTDDFPLSWQTSKDGEFIGGMCEAGGTTKKIEMRCLEKLETSRRSIADSLGITLRMDTLSPFYHKRENVEKYWKYLYDKILGSDKPRETVKTPVPKRSDPEKEWFTRQFTIKDGEMVVIA